ncbi:MAG TPA: LacI family DNA-binding transcriptional regulator [Symbiobacteriaceae bacterium]|nr:LacI family DNA-binding transcriptional regulator [Symbiobacteriaceae bacterium]
MTVTIKDVAREADVAPSTVSKVLSGTGSISEATRQRVQEAMQRLGYRPNAAARTLVTGQSGAIGVVVNRAAQLAFANPFFLEVLRSVGEVAEQEGYSLVVRTGADREDEEGKILELLRTRRVAGMVFPSSRVADHLLAELVTLRQPFVLIGRPESPNPDIPWVNTDNIGDSYRATQLLLSRGHKNVVLVSGPTQLLVNQDRQSGYLQAMAEAGLAPTVVAAGYSLDSAFAAMTEWLEQDPAPAALLCTDDLKAVGVYKAVQRSGRRLPDDMALLTFNDVPLAELLNPPLSCIRVPMADLGTQAATMLFALLKGQELAQRQVILPTEIVLRGSC